MRTCGVVVGVVVTLALLAGCSLFGGPGRTDVDRRRVDAVLDLPFFSDGHVRKATGSPSADADFRRAQISVRLAGGAASATPTGTKDNVVAAFGHARDRVRDAAQRLTQAGWQIGYVACVGVEDVARERHLQLDRLQKPELAQLRAGAPLVVQGWRRLGSGDRAFTAYLTLTSDRFDASARVMVPFHAEDPRPVPVPAQAIDPTQTCLKGPWQDQQTRERGERRDLGLLVGG